ncbi:FkbM family methyltransferase [Halomonas sp. HP20-15]|uniref:FkbM family methyltransferase n=1 Tax=Halomonas sp. HP20-15 TaxID=3085901 RepID=UPI002980D722|nr:FkbM family methyltransferase [Halomonas sp. HP20-15]MDW5375702.1 FkbM family methyltransferase [Halomonas sp. HP20-15]
MGHSSAQIPRHTQKSVIDLYRKGKVTKAMREAQALTQRYPQDDFAWKVLGSCLLQTGDFLPAQSALETARSLGADDPLTLNALARACFMLGEQDRAIELQRTCLSLDAENPKYHFQMANMLYKAGVGDRALPYLVSAERLGHDTVEILTLKSAILSLSFKFQEGWEQLQRLYALKPNEPTVHNSLGNYYKDMADFENAALHYTKAQELAPNYVSAYSNELMSLHYDPDATVERVLELAKAWQQRFGPESAMALTETDRDGSRPIRVGLVSASLRMHPVGWMVTSALAALPGDIKLYAYSDSDAQDFITQRIRQSLTHWQPVYHLDDTQLAERIRDDQIDILIDLAGHGSGSRLRTMAMRPAPLLIKWVGIQISSMGIPAFDYFLSDAIETPPGCDAEYTEKLIRLPDDYICYQPPYYKPAVTALPSIKNGYITLGCFNNPAKVNDVVLKEWARLMQELPNCRLLLKGSQYTSELVCKRIYRTMAAAGIAPDRLILEGPVKHQELLEAYRRVDIALDPWPYSGGLTTCEALLMGVPVVTLPGPTFAGRHSATHLINAGMPELVVANWDEYRQRVIELATDLPSLAVIRASLRTYLQQSPVCDDRRFGRHLHKALRAIWQRHCEGKAPAALTFNKGGSARFEDEDKSYRLPAALRVHEEGIDWDLDGPIMAIDNGAQLATHEAMERLLGEGHIALLTLDPSASLPIANHLGQCGEFQYYPGVTLGDGQPIVSDDNDELAETTTIPSIALDSIEGLKGIDMLVLDDGPDSLTILEHGERALSQTLLIQARVKFNPENDARTNLGSLTQWAGEHGFRFHRLHNAEYHSHMPESDLRNYHQASELVSADAIYIPTVERFTALSNSQRMKLACALHTLYGIKDVAHRLIYDVDAKKAELYSAIGENSKKSPPQLPTKIRNIHDAIQYYENCRLTRKSPNHGLPSKLVVSLTSYKDRFSTLHLTLRTLLCQSVTPDELVLWIAYEDKNLLPEKVTRLEDFGLRIRFCENLKSYKKIIPTLKYHSDWFIVTADDDIYYSEDWLGSLTRSWDNNYKTVVAHRAHKIKLDAKGAPTNYTNWTWTIGKEEIADGLIFPTSGAGVLFPPGIFHRDISNREKFTKLCPDADDIWLYWMFSLNGGKAKLSDHNYKLIEWPHDNATPLWHKNIKQGGNDKQIGALLKEYGKPWPLNVIEDQTQMNILTFYYGAQAVRFFLPNSQDHIQKIIRTEKTFYEEKMLLDIQRISKPGGVILDVGANIGNHAVFFGLLCKANHVLCLEPHPKTFSTLIKNISINNLSEKIKCFQAGAGNKESKAMISHYDEKNTGMSKLSLEHDGDIEITTLDTIIEKEGRQVDIIKMDIEGMELKALEGAKNILTNQSPVIYIEAGTDDHYAKIKNFLRHFDYHPYERFNATATYRFEKTIK